ncbi:MAG: DUF4214 domain-containing protein [Acidimicrobiia bacterium]|nr:DUF4214 domain-containing protein [Acidimicrobiia bacterium]
MVISSMVILEPGHAAPVAAAPAAPAAPIARDPGGRWGPVEDWPMVAIHSALDSNGRVVTYGTNPDGTQTGRFIYDIWTPSASAASGHNTLANTTRTDVFCSLQLNRSDTGDMILFGGDNWTGMSTTGRGNADINQIDAKTGAVAPLPGMNRARWYATGTTMPNGSIYVQGGLDGEDRPEQWTPEQGAELLPIDTSGIDWYYPRHFVIPDGRIFGIANDRRMYYVSESLKSLDFVGRLPAGYGGNTSTAVMFEPGRILLVGGATTQALIIDVTGGGTPAIRSAGNLSSTRQWLDGTLLPDGRVLVTGGAVRSSSQRVDDPIATYGSSFTAEIWDPRTGEWTVGDSAQVPRLYHSTALLLPDGRVLTAGGGSPGPITNTDAELYHPDYLTRADGSPMPRPTIDGVSDVTLTAGQRLVISVPDGADIARVTMVKSGSVTHSFNMDQRFVELDFVMNRDTANGDRVVTHLPDNDAVITPGYYLLSVLDSNGIPSESEMVKVEVPDPARPTSTLDGQIVRLYQAAFERLPSGRAFVYWRRQMINGIPAATVAASFAASGEFGSRYGQLGAAGFVDQLYRNVLGRTPSTTERSYWMGELAAGATRADLLLAFAESAEFRHRTGTNGLRPADIDPGPAPVPAPTDSDAAAYEGEVRRLYLGAFRREPDAAGLAYWIGMRAKGISLVAVADEFATSAEVRARYGQTSNGQYVDLVYLNVLGRPSDPGGRDYWLRQLGAGVTRGEVMVAFTESPENIAATG